MDGPCAGARVADRYVLRHPLGRGAAGVVWLATHELLTRDYAIKFLDPQAIAGSSADELVERFRFEAQVSCALGAGTERIVAVHDAGVFENQPYMVMDLVRGESVLARLRRDAMPMVEISRMLRDVAEALAACHHAGIAHRDTKPANILRVNATGSYKLADFGLAKFFGAEASAFLLPRETVGSMLVGTPAYMSPEAISADKTACGRGDVWSLAVTLYECLTRSLPFQGEGWPAVAVSIMRRRCKRASEHGEHLARFDPLFEKAFAREIEDRFRTPAELVEAFERVAEEPAPCEEVIPSNEVIPEPRALQNFSVDSVPKPSPKSHRATAILLVAVLGGAMTVMALRATHEPSAPAASSSEPAEQAVSAEPHSEASGQTRVPVSASASARLAPSASTAAPAPAAATSLRGATSGPPVPVNHKRAVHPSEVW